MITASPLQEPEVTEIVEDLVSAICEVFSRRGDEAKGIVVIARSDEGNSTLTIGCTCEACLSGMIETLTKIRDGELSKLPDPSCREVH